LQLQTTVSFKMKHTEFGLYNQLFSASHALLMFERHKSIKTPICPTLYFTLYKCHVHHFFASLCTAA